MDSLRDRIKAKNNRPTLVEHSSRPSRNIDGTSREKSVRQMLEEGAKDFLGSLKFTGASFPGPPGVGVPNDGFTGYVLTKNSPRDFDTSWQPGPVAAGGGYVLTTGTTIDAINNAIALSQQNGNVEVVVPGLAGNQYYLGGASDSILLAATLDATTQQMMLPTLRASGYVVLDMRAHNIPSTPMVLVSGVSGKDTLAKMHGFSFLGSTTNSIGIDNRGLCFWEAWNCHFFGSAEVARCTGRGDGSMFTEGFQLRDCKLRGAFGTGFRYFLQPGSGNNPSAHGSGFGYPHNLVELNTNYPAVQVDNKTNPYSCPLYIRAQSNGAGNSVGTLGGCVLVLNYNDSDAEPDAKFYGHLELEAFQFRTTKIIGSLSAGPVPVSTFFEGGIIGIGMTRGNGAGSTNTDILGFRAGDMLFGPWINGNVNGTTNLPRSDYSLQQDLVPGTNTINVGVSGMSRLTLQIRGTNYVFIWKGTASLDPLGGSAVFTDSQPAYIFDNTGLSIGVPSLSANTAGRLQITSANFPITGMTCFVEITKISELSFQSPAAGANRLDFALNARHDFINTAVSVNTITIDTNQGMFTASPMIYRSVADSAGTVGSIANLVDGTTYYAILPFGGIFTTIQLALTPADAFAGTAIALGLVTAGTGNWTFSVLG